MGKKIDIEDLLGDETYSTSQFKDPEPILTADGLLAVLTPRDANLATDSEDDDAYAVLEEDLSPGEAQRVLDTMRTLSKQEAHILDDMPELESLRRVDDPEQEKWLLERQKDGYKAMDKVLEDSVYGDHMDKEEKLERLGRDSDIGFGFGSITHAFKRAVSAPLSAAKWAGRKTVGAAMHFIPGRDRAKAKMTRDAFQKLMVQHANWLGLQDQQAGRPVQTPAVYQQQSRPWALAQLKQAGLPTSFAMSGADVLGAAFVGEDVMGSWYNPISWFQNIISTVFNGPAKQQMSPVGPDGSSQVPLGPDGQPIDPSQMMMPDGSTPAASTYPQDGSTMPQDGSMPSYPDQSAYPQAYPQDGSYAYSQGDGDVTTGISGEDSLGAVTAQILAGPAPGRASTADQMIAAATNKLSHGYPINPGELAVIARLAKGGHPGAKKLYANLMQVGTSKVQLSGNDESGDWLYKLNPFRYITKSSEERDLEDKEREGWSKNAEMQKDLAKRQKVLSQAEKAQAAQQAVEDAKKQAAATEAQLKAIESSLAGVLVAPARKSATVMGHEKPTAISKVVSNALEEAGKKDRAAELYAKILDGKPLAKADLADVKEIAKILHKTKVIHGDLYAESPEHSAMHGAFVGAAMIARVRGARRQNALCGRAALVLQKKIEANGGNLSKADKDAVLALHKKTAELQGVVRSHVSGRGYAHLDRAKQLQRTILAGTMGAAMTDVEKQQLLAIQKLAKAGNPRAAYALEQLKKSGVVVGGDFIGFGISDAFKVATAPIWWPTKQLVKGAKWMGQQTGIISKGSPSPEQVRLNMMQAAYKRRVAAAAKARAADAQTEAELRAQQSIADAANAEADAADAAALAQEAAMRTKEINADPSQSPEYQGEVPYQSSDEDGDSSGAFVGAWTEHVDDELGKKVVAKAAKKDATGAKIRAGAKMYVQIKKGDPKAKASLKAMIARSQKGDAQATSDLRAVYAGRKAVLAKQKAQKKQARLAAAKARKLRVIAAQRRLEALAANKLARMERKHHLNKMSRVERKAAAGNKKAKTFVAHQVAAAKRGDKRAKHDVAYLQLAHKVNQAAPSKRERRNLAAAGHLYKRALKNDPKAIRQIQVIDAAAKRGNPNAKRAMKRLAMAKQVDTMIAAGAVAAAATAAASKKKRGKKTKAEKAALVAKAKAKKAAGGGSREEMAAGARAAQELGDKETARELATAAVKSPSATESLQKTAAVVKAKEAGNAEAKEAIDTSFAAAKSGDPAEIKKMGGVVAAQTLDDINQGKPVPPAMRDAVNLQERIAAKDPAAIEEAKQISQAATLPNPPPEAIAAAITLAAAAITAQAMAAKPQARQEFLDKVNPPLPPAEQADAAKKLDAYVASAKAGTITAEEGVAALRLAERLQKPRVAAQIAAMAPPPPPPEPLTSLPDVPQMPIKGGWNLVKESLRALTFSTRDPLANWREGVVSMSSRAPASPVAAAVGHDDGMGWSPFAWLRRNLAIILPSISTATSAATLAVAVANKKAGGAPKPAAPAPAPAAAAPAAPAATAPATAPAVSPTPAESSGDEDGPHMTDEVRKIIASAVDAKRMSRQDFNRAVKLYAGPNATDKEKAAVGARMLTFLQKKKIALDTSMSGVGADKTFKDYIAQAISDKKISRGDFNRAVDAQAGAGAAPQVKTAVGQKVLEFLNKKGVAVST